MPKRASIYVVLLCIVLAQPAWSDFTAGKRAYDKGDYATALKEWRPLAEQGDPAAQYNLGVMYAQGKGVLQDYAEAVRWYRKAADQGEADAQFFLGLRYDRGDGVPRDYVQAHMWLNLAAAKGDAGAIKNRDSVATKMTPTQIAEARALARNWKPNVTANDQPAQDRVFRVAEVMPPPKVIFKVEPDYTRRASRESVQGAVLLSIIVTSKGDADSIRVLTKLHPDLDQKAIEAVRQWKFSPAMKDGKAVSCAATVQVNFHLVDRKGQPLPFKVAAPKTGEPSTEPKVEVSAPKPSPEPGLGRVTEKGDSRQGDRVAENAPRKEGRDVDFFGSPQTDLRKSTNKLRLRTENFELVTDWREEDQLGQLLLALERARALFLHLYNQVPTGVVKVFVNQSLEETRSACQTSQGVGCYSSRSGAHSIILSKDAFSRGAAAPAVHEYTHLTQNLMGYASAPPWVNEGIAGYYETVEFKQGKLYVGYLDPQRPIPAWFSVDAILAMDYATLKSRLDLKGTQGFYAQSHLLLHMLRHTPRYSVRLAELLGAIKNGKDSREAIQQFFGISTSQLNVEFVEYYRRGKYQKVEVYEGIKVPNTVTVEGSSGQTLTVKERKCTWCGVRRVMRHMPIIIPIP